MVVMHTCNNMYGISLSVFLYICGLWGWSVLGRVYVRVCVYRASVHVSGVCVYVCMSVCACAHTTTHVIFRLLHVLYQQFQETVYR